MNLAVLASGGGTNLQAILDAVADGTIPDTRVAVVGTNRAGAGALERAARAGVATFVLDHRGFGDRQEYDRALVDRLRGHDVDTVALAGFMRIVTPTFIDAFPSRVVNIHPALLPSFPGLLAVRQALEHGVRVTGVTVHLVDAGVDTGPIVLQEAVPIFDGDDEDSLLDRVHAVEHRLYPGALKLLAQGRLSVRGRRVFVAPELS